MTWNPKPFRVSLPDRGGNLVSGEFRYLSRRPRHPRGDRSYGLTGRGGGTGPGWSHLPCSAHRPGRWGPSRHRTDHSSGPPGPFRSPAAGTPPVRLAGPRGRRTRSPRCHCRGSPRGPRTCCARPPASPPADLQEPKSRDAREGSRDSRTRRHFQLENSSPSLQPASPGK